jgi:hypothetical protein
VAEARVSLGSKGVKFAAKAAPKGKAAKTESISVRKAGEPHGKASPVEEKQVPKAVQFKAAREVPEGLSKKYFIKSTFNTHDIMHSPVEKTLKMLDKILAGERLFTM